MEGQWSRLQREEIDSQVYCSTCTLRKLMHCADLNIYECMLAELAVIYLTGGLTASGEWALKKFLRVSGWLGLVMLEVELEASFGSSFFLSFSCRKVARSAGSPPAGAGVPVVGGTVVASGGSVGRVGGKNGKATALQYRAAVRARVAKNMLDANFFSKFVERGQFSTFAAWLLQ